MRYLVLKFEHDHEFDWFTHDLEAMLVGNSNPPFSVKIIGEGVEEPFSGLFGGQRTFKVTAIE